MGWWFGRKSAPADARPFVPAWLCSDAAEEGFARSDRRAPWRGARGLPGDGKRKQRNDRARDPTAPDHHYAEFPGDGWRGIGDDRSPADRRLRRIAAAATQRHPSIGAMA